MTTTAAPSRALAVAEPVFSNQERLALARFLAGYTGNLRCSVDPVPYRPGCAHRPDARRPRTAGRRRTGCCSVVRMDPRAGM